MIDTTTHIAESVELTLCGLALPVVAGPRAVVAGARVGLTIGRFTYSCYLTGEKDSNAACVVCEAMAAEGQGEEHRSWLERLRGKAGM